MPKPRRPRRRSPAELPMPAFGTPYGGRQCPTCSRWFPAGHFWRGTTRKPGSKGTNVAPTGHYVKRCGDCIAAGVRTAPAS